MTLGSLVLGLCLLFVFLLVNGLFVAFEYAVVSLRRSRVEELVKHGHVGAKRVQALQKQMDRTIAGSQLGITLASLAIGWLGDHSILPLIKHIFSWLPAVASAQLPAGVGVALSFIVLSMLHVIIGENVPKRLGLQMPETVAFWLVVPFRLFTIITAPLVFVMNFFAKTILHLLGAAKVSREEEGKLPSNEEFQILFEEAVKAGTLGKQESDLLKRALDLKALTVREVMIPRTRMDSVEDGVSLLELLGIVVKTRHSKLPVFRGTRDNVIGILNTRDVFDVLLAHMKSHEQAQAAAGKTSGASTLPAKDKPFKLHEHIRQAYFVPETMLASTLLEELKKRKIQMAIVLDEFGSTVGLVTQEDLIEQLVGDIHDEYDLPATGIEKVSEDVFHVSGELTLFEFNKSFQTSLSCETHCVTIAGWVIEALDHQPEHGESIELNGFRFTVLEMRGRAISKLEAKRLPAESVGAPEAQTTQVEVPPPAPTPGAGE
ncbi:MAG TPA: hemolysin family protein [Candidatus Obscuribacterales bacterium]